MLTKDTAELGNVLIFSFYYIFGINRSKICSNNILSSVVKGIVYIHSCMVQCFICSSCTSRQQLYKKFLQSFSPPNYIFNQS